MTDRTERLQKVMAHAGIASRRASEALILAGRVKVNGQVVTELGTKVDPKRDKIVVDDTVISKKTESLVYIALNKPSGVLSAASDDRGRKTVLDLVDVPERIYPVGRLDLNSEGLILLTNDGSLAERMMHPRYHVEKEYQVLVKGKPSLPTLEKWRKGQVELEGEATAPATVQILNVEKDNNVWLRVVITEGRKRQIREIAKILGHPVLRLERVRMGTLKLGQLRVGKWRHLNPGEINRLKELVAGKGQKSTRRKSAPPKSTKTSSPKK